MYLSGWAYTSKAKETKEKYKTILKKIEPLKEFINVESVRNEYNKTVHSGKLLPNCPKITEEELLVYIDRGNLCFGGTCSIYNDGFECIVYTD